MKSFYDLFWKLFYGDEDFWKPFDGFFDENFSKMWNNDIKKLYEKRNPSDDENATKKNEHHQDEKETSSVDYVQTDQPVSVPGIYFPPFFLVETVDDKEVYVHREDVGKNIKPDEIEISIYKDGLSLYMSHGDTKSGSGWSSITSGNRIPDDLDKDTLKAVLKNGTLTITADKLKLQEEEPEKEFEQEEDVEYEIEIGK